MASCNPAEEYEDSCEGDDSSEQFSPGDPSNTNTISDAYSLKEPPDIVSKDSKQKLDAEDDYPPPLSNHCNSHDESVSSESMPFKSEGGGDQNEMNGSCASGSEDSASNNVHDESAMDDEVHDESAVDDEVHEENESLPDEDMKNDEDSVPHEPGKTDCDSSVEEVPMEVDEAITDKGTTSTTTTTTIPPPATDKTEVVPISATGDASEVAPPNKNIKEDGCSTDEKEKEKAKEDTECTPSKTATKSDTSSSVTPQSASKEEEGKTPLRRSERQRSLRNRQVSEDAVLSPKSEGDEPPPPPPKEKTRRSSGKASHHAVRGALVVSNAAAAAAAAAAASSSSSSSYASEKPHTIIVTETKSLAQVINNAVRKDMGGSQEGRPTLVIIETKTPSELPALPKASSCITNTITLQTALSKCSPATTLTPVNTMVTVANQFTKPVSTTANNSSCSSLTTSIIEDGGMAVEVPSLVVPYLIEYPPSRTISEFLKMLPLDPKELKELEEAKQQKALNALAAASASTSTTAAGNSPIFANPIGRPKTADRWGAYFETSLGKFFVDIGLNLAKEWVQNDLVKSQKRKADKEGKTINEDRALASLVRSLADTKEKNEPFHHPLKKCEHCSFRTESSLVMKHHYTYPHERHMDYYCNFCKHRTRLAHDIIFHMEAEHGIQARVERPRCFHHCPLCEFEDNSRAKVTKHSFKCQKKFCLEKNMGPTPEFDPPAKRPKVYPIIPPGMPFVSGKLSPMMSQFSNKSKITIKPKDYRLPVPGQTAYRTLSSTNNVGGLFYRSGNMMYSSQSVGGRSGVGQPPVFLPSNQSVMVNQMMSSSSHQYPANQIYQVVNSSGQLMPISGNFGQLNSPRFTILPTSTSNSSSLQGGPTPVALVPNIATATPSRSVLLNSATSRMQSAKPNISITPVTKPSITLTRARLPTPSTSVAKLGVQNASSFVVCEICDGYIKDLEQLRTHMQWIHKVKIHPKMIFNRPPLNCQKCQFRFFTDQGLERHLLGAHGLVTSSMQENANKGQDSGRCTICGKVFQWKLLAHMSKDHNMILKPAHLSYKCTVCAATFGMYKLFETHVYQAHSTVAKRVLDAPEDKKKAPQLQSVKTVEVKPVTSSTTLSCSECGMPFTKVGNYLLHWETKHLKPCSVKLCRIDQCRKCLSEFQGITPWTESDEELDDDEEDDECDEIESVVDLTETGESLSSTPLKHDSSVEIISTKQPTESSEQDEAVLDMDIETHDEIDEAIMEDEVEEDVEEDGEDEDDEEEETALDMEVESHDVEPPSPDSVHTDDDDELAVYN